MPLVSEYDALRFVFDGYRVPLGRVLAEPGFLVEHFREISDHLGQEFQPSERMIAQLTRFALTQDTAKAVELGEIRTALYPESFRAYELLGAVYAEREQPERARSYYEEALARSPGNDSIEEKLGGLGR